MTEIAGQVDGELAKIVGAGAAPADLLTALAADLRRGVAITDGYASSGGDIVIQALKSYGIATVVGTRTWGGVRGR